MKRYKKRDGKQSYSRLCCENCAGRHDKDRSKRFADRDLNAAANILLIGTSLHRPESLSRSRNKIVKKRRRSEDSSNSHSSKRVKPSVGAEGTLSDPEKNSSTPIGVFGW